MISKNYDTLRFNYSSQIESLMKIITAHQAQCLYAGKKAAKNSAPIHSDSQTSLRTENTERPEFCPKGTTPETVQLVKDIVVTGLHFLFAPVLH